MRSSLARALATIGRYLDPRRPEGGHVKIPHLIVVALIVAGFLVAGLAGGKAAINWHARHIRVLKHLTPAQQQTLLTMQPKLGATPTCYVPPVSLMRLTGVYAVIESEYDYDSSTLGSVACQDSDFMEPPGSSEPLHLPGPSWTQYIFDGTQFILGSGYEDTFTTPNGGRWAFYHLFALAGLQVGQRVPGDTVIARTGWPSSALYSNGSCYDSVSCANDAHECISTDYAGAQWLYTLANYPPPKPKPKPKPVFPLAKWRAYTSRHHKPAISPYAHGKMLGRSAALWWKHGPTKSGGIVSHEQYVKPRHGAGYLTVRFETARLWWWPGHPTWVKWQRVRTIR